MADKEIIAEKPGVAILIRTLGLGGAEKQSILLANSLSEKYKVHLILQFGNIIDEKHLSLLDKKNVTLHKLSGNRIRKILSIYKIIRKEKVRIVFPYLMSDNIIAFLATLFNKKVKVAGGVRNCYLPKSKYVTIKTLHKINHSVTIFNNVSGREEFIRRGFSPIKSKVILNCIEHILPPVERAESKSINIVTVGRFVAQKDYFTALKAFKQLVNEVGDEFNLKYSIVGYGELEQRIRDEIARLELGNFVEVAIKPKDVPSFYQKAHIYLCSSLFEGVSNSIMEAMNYSLPIVATNVGDNNILVRPGENGFLVDPGNANALVEPLKSLIKNHKLRKSFGKSSNSLLKQEFGEEKFKENYCLLIDTLIN